MAAFKTLVKLVFLAALVACFAVRHVDTTSEDDEEATNSVRAGDEEFHKFRKRHYKKVKAGSSYTTVPLLVDEDKHYWRNLGQLELRKQLQLQSIVKKAKNVILFLGDGMSIATVTAARILKGQRTGEWEHEELVFEDFPYTALLKTYTADSQVADSAASATAYLCGVKANLGTIGVDNNVEKENCSAQHNSNYHTTSILRWFQDAGRSSGLVTNMRVTHATPAGAYAHIADREWEDDHEVSGDGLDSANCDDIAEQLVMGETGRKLKVIMGGGRRNLQPRESRDVEEGRKGYRRDGKDLIKAWEADKRSQGLSHAYVWNKDQLLNLTATDYLLGLFAWSHMDYLLDREHQQDPSLEQMTRAAINVLERDTQGYFLLVEGGLIDHGHHGNKARKALTETLEMDAAVQTALDMTDPSDTLIVVTADHSHSMTLNGYPGRHTDILGFADLSNVDYLPYHTLLYGNGPGYRPSSNRGRINPSGDNTHERNYRQPAAVPESSSAHSGDDVGVWAVGPHAHLFTGTHDQVYLAHAMAYAACVGDGITFCKPNGGGTPGGRGGQQPAPRSAAINRRNVAAAVASRLPINNNNNNADGGKIGNANTQISNINSNNNNNNVGIGGVTNGNVNTQISNINNNNDGNDNANLGIVSSNNPSTGNVVPAQRINSVGQRNTARNNNDGVNNNNILRKRSGNTSIITNNNGVNNIGKSLTAAGTASDDLTNISDGLVSVAASTNINRGRSRWTGNRGRWRGR